MRQDYLKRFGIDACLDDVRAKTEHIMVVCEVEALEVLAASQQICWLFWLTNKPQGAFSLAAHKVICLRFLIMQRKFSTMSS